MRGMRGTKATRGTSEKSRTRWMREGREDVRVEEEEIKDDNGSRGRRRIRERTEGRKGR